ncbi:MAG: phosphoribosylglycinamide formyltransferase [Alphaproteobacteria bacterium]|nr:phosphoribosylglycinamide formyltransferase [Alphaproteobacteria bacterium]
MTQIPTRLAVLISGRGSNLRSLLQEFPPLKNAENPKYFNELAEICLVISNRPDAAGLRFAEQASVPRLIIDHQLYPARADFDAALEQALEAAKIDLVCLAGFMRLLTPEFVTRWQDRMINIHPSLLPNYKGLHTHRRVLAAGEPETGCTVHFVRPAMDEGPIIAQSRVAVLPDDTEEILAERVLAAEHLLYPTAIRRVLAHGFVGCSGVELEHP